MVHKVPKQDVWTFWGTRRQKERKAILDNVQAFCDISGHDYGDDYDDDSDGNDDNDHDANSDKKGEMISEGFQWWQFWGIEEEGDHDDDDDEEGDFNDDDDEEGDFDDDDDDEGDFDDDYDEEGDFDDDEKW